MDLPEPGTRSYVPSLLSALHSQPSLAGWSPDLQLFSTILLCLMVARSGEGRGSGGILVDVKMDDLDKKVEGSSRRRAMGAVKNHLAAITSGVFGMRTSHTHIPRDAHPDLIPLAFLLKPNSSDRRSSTIHSNRSQTGSHSPSHSHFRQRPGSRTPSHSHHSKSASHSPSRVTKSASTLRNQPALVAGTRSAGMSTPAYTPTPSTNLSSTYGSATSEYFDAFHGPPSASLNGPSSTPFPLSSSQPTPALSPQTSRHLLRTHPQLVDSPGEIATISAQGDIKHPGPLEIPHVLIVSGLENAQSPVWIKLVNILVERKVELPYVEGAESGDQCQTLDLPGDFLIIWIRDRSVKIDIPWYLIDQFGLSTSLHPSDVAPPPPHLDRQPLIPPDYLRDLASLVPFTHIHPPLQMQIATLLSGVSAHPRLETTVSGKVMRAFPDYVRAHRLLAQPFTLPKEWKTQLAQFRQKREVAEMFEQGVRLPHPSMSNCAIEYGNVDIWAEKAGEARDYRDLRDRKDDETDGQEWYARIEDVRGVWSPCLRHRVTGRGAMDELIWILTGASEPIGKDDGSKSRKIRQRRADPDRILEQVIAGV